MEEETLQTAMTAERPRNCEDAATLRRLMDDESAANAFYRALACRSGQRTAQRFRSLAADEARHLRQLQTEYFLLTGDSYNPAESEPVEQGQLSALRTAFRAEQSAYEDYMRAAQNTASTALAGLYVANAADEAGHAQTLRCMVESVMG